MELYLTTSGVKVSKKKESFYLETDRDNFFLSSEKIERIILEGEISITSGALKLAIKNDIPIIISDSYGNVLGQFYKMNPTKNSDLRKKQYLCFSSDFGMELGKNWILEKMLYQKQHLETLLKKRNKELKSIFILNNYIKKVYKIHKNTKESISEIMGFEGVASKIYFNTISSLLKDEWKFEKREHQNATSYYNIVLNYSFGILYHKVESYILKEGFDSSIGILHSNGYNKLPFLYDFIEKYRYIALESTYELFSKNIVTKEFFTSSERKLTIFGRRSIGVYLKSKLNTLIMYNNKKYKLEDTIQLELKKVKRIILGERQ